MRKIVKNLQNKTIICISIKKDKKKLLFELKRKKMSSILKILVNGKANAFKQICQ